MTIRPLLSALSLVASIGIAAPPAFAQDYPNRPIRLVIPGPPGGGTDVMGRMMAEGLTAVLGATVIPENKPGASGMLGAQQVLNAPADGYTLFMAFSATMTTNQWLYENITYDPLKDFVPVAAFAQVPNVLLVHPSVPVHTVSELVALAKSKPGKLNFASSYPGSVSHLTMEMFKLSAGIDMRHIPFNGDAPSVTALVGGQVETMVTNTVNCLALVKAGKLRPLAVTTANRAAVLPDLPTMAESGLAGFESNLWYGVAAAAGTPPEIVEKLNAAIRKSLSTPEMKARLGVSGSEPMLLTTKEFAALVKRDAAAIGKVVKSANIKRGT